MRIAIVSNYSGLGLEKDARLLTGFLTACGHQVTGFQFDQIPKEIPEYELAIFLEVIPRPYLALSKTRWFLPNLEWVKDGLVDIAKKHMQKVFAKTKEAERVLSPLIPGKVHYSGFLAEDKLDPSIKPTPRFLHVGGQSALKGSQAVYDAFAKWRKEGRLIDAELTLISSLVKEENIPANVRLVDHVSDQELRELMNSHFFHLCPSGTEGFGHTLHEGQSTGALVVTIGRPPMSELRDAYFIESCGQTRYNLADIWQVSALEIQQAAEAIKSFYPGILNDSYFQPRQRFLEDNNAFMVAFEKHLDAFSPVVEEVRVAGERPTVAFLGNFQAPESTENMIAWALEERLGFHVERLQENETKHIGSLGFTARSADYFLWVRTPGWLEIPDNAMKGMLLSLRLIGVPSISMHLDKFWGIPEREALIGVHPFWLTKFVFTADGSRQKDFAARGVNHHFMPAAASEVYHHRGKPRDYWRCDVAFVGARNYHREHPWRGEMIEFLEQTYGDRFQLIEAGLRGHDLNDFYSSARVCIGDWFGSGKIPNYWSDRAPETCLRYGFLLAPATEGLDIPCATFEPENLDDLKSKIDYWLEHEEERREKIEECAHHVALFDTWTVRLESIFATVKEAKNVNA